MTCIVGVIDERTGEVWMGSDSFCGGAEGGFPLANRKLFRHGELLIGYCGQNRAAQIVEYCAEFPKWEKDFDVFSFLVSRWIPAIRAAIGEHGGDSQIDGADELKSAFLVAARGRLFFVGGDFAVDEFAVYGAAGSGECVALGALSFAASTALPWSPQAILTTALEAAALHMPTVAPPFHIEKL